MRGGHTWDATTTTTTSPKPNTTTTRRADPKQQGRETKQQKASLVPLAALALLVRFLVPPNSGNNAASSHARRTYLSLEPKDKQKGQTGRPNAQRDQFNGLGRAREIIPPVAKVRHDDALFACLLACILVKIRLLRMVMGLSVERNNANQSILEGFVSQVSREWHTKEFDGGCQRMDRSSFGLFRIYAIDLCRTATAVLFALVMRSGRRTERMVDRTRGSFGLTPPFLAEGSS